MVKQVDRLLSWLEDGSWHCAEEFLDGHLITYSQRASEVNALHPGRIETRPCKQRGHNCYQYRDSFAAAPKQLQLRSA